MKRYICISISHCLTLLCCFLTASCSSTRVLNSFEEAKLLKNESVEIHLNSGKFYWTDNLIVKKDSTTLLDKSSGSFISIPTEEIKYIKDIHHTLGAFEWLGLGVVLGITYGAIWDKTTKWEHHSGVDPRAYFGAVGGIMGILPGSLIGHRIYYILPLDSKDSAKFSSSRTQ